MDENCRQGADLNSMWVEWSKSMLNFWQSAASSWQAMFTPPAGKQAEEEFPGGWISLWSKFMNHEAMQEMGSYAAFTEVSAAVGRSFFDGCLRFQELVASFGAGGRGPAGDADLSRAGHDMFQAWIDFHRKEIQPLLRVPQVGLTRFYQEKVNRLIDQFASYQGAVGEFQNLLCLPLEKSLREVRSRLEKDKKEKLAGDLKEYYSYWIKILEGHYMQLFQSPEWNWTLCRLVDEASDFRISKDEIIMDFLQFLPIPTNRDMDDVYKELYTLKKMVKELAKKLENQEHSLQ